MSPPLLLADRLWPPFRGAIMTLSICAGALGSFGLFQLGIRYAAPSDPCRADDAACLASDRAWLTSGLVALAAASALLLGAVVLATMRRRLLFVVPPGWPLPPPGWRPRAGWWPDPSWPNPPEDWEFWRRR